MGTDTSEAAGRADFDDAFVPLFRTAYISAYRLLRNAADAEDVAAETLARALADWSKVGPLPYLDAWIVRVATNLAIDRLRQLRRTQPAEPSPNVNGVDMATTLDLVRALKKLPRRQREVIVLRYVAALPERDVADLLGLSAETVKEHAARGRTSLRATLGPEFMGAMSWS